MAKVAITENSLNVLNYVKEHEQENITAVDIAEALGGNSRSINGTLTGLQKRGYTVRIPAEVELEDGTKKTIKLIETTDEGKAYNHEDALAQDEAEKKAAAAAKANKAE